MLLKKSFKNISALFVALGLSCFGTTASAMVTCYTYHVTSSNGSQQACGVKCSDNTYYPMGCGADIFSDGYDIEYQESVAPPQGGFPSSTGLWEALLDEGIAVRISTEHAAPSSVDPVNPNNPYDFIGAEHNALLDGFAKALGSSLPYVSTTRGAAAKVVTAAYEKMASMTSLEARRPRMPLSAADLAEDLPALRSLSLANGLVAAIDATNLAVLTATERQALLEFEAVVAGIEHLDTYVAVAKVFEDRANSDLVTNTINVAKYSRVYWENQGAFSPYYPLIATTAEAKAKGKWWKIVGADAAGALAGGYVGAQIGGPWGAVIGAVGWGGTCSLYAAAKQQEQ